MRWCGHSDY